MSSGKRISDRSNHSLTRYLREIPAYPPSNAGDQRGKGPEVDLDAGKSPEELVLSNLFFVVKLAGGYRNRGVPFEDLLNEGNIGLMHAAARYDHRRGVKFQTYAAWWIRKVLSTALEEQGATIRVPDYQRRKAARLRADDEASQEKHGHNSAGPRCDECGPAPVGIRLHRMSLHSDGDDDRGGNLLDTLADRRVRDPLHEMLTLENTAGLHQCISQLTAIEREVIEGRFGLSGNGVRTLNEVGVTLGLSRERIRQIEVKAKEKLRTYMSRASARTERSLAG